MTMSDLSLSLQFGDLRDAEVHRRLLSRSRVRRLLSHALLGPAEITVRVVGQDEGRKLNRIYRGKDYPTNVLTFDYSSQPVVRADLVLCAPVVVREAHQQGKALLAHYAHLLIHAGLHAQGYDHETNDRCAMEMEALEILLLSSLGFPNPY